jgi:hypothetical protein
VEVLEAEERQQDQRQPTRVVAEVDLEIISEQFQDQAAPEWLLLNIPVT